MRKNHSPFMNQNGENWYCIHDQNCWKTIPFGTPHTYIADIREYLPRGVTLYRWKHFCREKTLSSNIDTAQIAEALVGLENAKLKIKTQLNYNHCHIAGTRTPYLSRPPAPTCSVLFTNRKSANSQGVRTNCAFQHWMAEFILGTNYPSQTNYMSETGNSSA